MFKNMLIHCSLIDVNKGVLLKHVKLSMLSLPSMANLATKTKTHYESLGLQPTATYNEIKSAYYKLTLKYHPDKNKSEFAKEKFNEISNAYDVLSKYETRKKYDRTQINNQNLQNMDNKRHEMYKGHEQLLYKYQSTDVFNFDNWVQQHYGDAFRKNILLKERQNTKLLKNIPDLPNLSIALIIFVITLVVLYIRDRIRNRKHEDFKAVQKCRNKPKE